MTLTADQPAPAPGPFDALLIALTERELTDAERADLFAHLSHHPADRNRYVDYIQLHATMSWDHARPVEAHNPKHLTPNAPRAATAAHPISKIENRKSKILLPLALAAALLLAACGVAIVALVLSSNQQSEINNQKSHASSPPIATLIESTGDVIINDGIANEGAAYPAGTYSIESGSAELLLERGTSVRLHGQTRLTVHSPMAATLTRGSATFDCPPRAKGYTVHLPHGLRVVDLGTRFTVEAGGSDGGGGGVRAGVLEGSVRVQRGTDVLATLTAGHRIVFDDGGRLKFSGTLAANVGVDDAGTGYESGWAPGAGPTGLDQPFAAWTSMATSGGGTATNQDGRFRIAAAGPDRATVKAMRRFNGELRPGQSFAYSVEYRWTNTGAEHEGNYLRLLDGERTVVELIALPGGHGVDSGALTLRTPAGLRRVIFADEPGRSEARKRLRVRIVMGAGEHEGMARVTTEGDAVFDSGWFTCEGSPDGFELFVTPANGNPAYDTYYDRFAIVAAGGTGGAGGTAGEGEAQHDAPPGPTQ